MRRLRDPRLIIWWSIAWAIAVMALAPLVNFITPFLNPSYANQWTPDLYWRLVLYWHGGIFIPWVTVLAALVCLKFGLNDATGWSGHLVRNSVFLGAYFAVPIGGIAGIFDVYDHFALGAPLWTQIWAFLIADEMAIALLLAIAFYPRTHGGYRKAGMPFYTIEAGVAGALFAAVMGHIGGWITWFGPWPQIVPQYVSSQLGNSNSTNLIMFTENVVGSHSHLMLVSLMAGVVALVAVTFGYNAWSRRSRLAADFGFGVMIASLLGAMWIYIVSGVGNYAIPTFFQSGLNGIAGDDIVTGFVGLGAAFVLAGFLGYSLGRDGNGRRRLSDSLLGSVVASWLVIYFVIPVTGYYIELNENFYQATGAGFDAAFTRFHQDFAFFLLPAVVTLVLVLEAYGISGKTRRRVGYLIFSGVLITFVFGEAYTMALLNLALLGVAVFGGFLIGLGALLGTAFLFKRSTTGDDLSLQSSASGTSSLQGGDKLNDKDGSRSREGRGGKG
ncbi:MAG: hypothetical protein JRM80_13185 [Nitrososphaerota archaeon]|nr:hypothetical protein [Nitrososphaerota archaeon]